MPIKDVESFKETVQALIASCSDKEDSVNSAVIKSLTRLASVHPNEVVEYICEYAKNPNSLSIGLLANLIKVLEQTCVNHMKAIKKELSSELVTVMLQAMTMTVDYEPAVQLGASSVLVAVGHVYLDLVLQTLIKQMTPASVPHYTIPHTLGTLAAVNTQIVVPFVKDILGKMLPLLPLVKVEGTKQAFAYAFGHFAVAISEQIGDNVENDSITSIKENFVVEFTVIFDVLYSQWLLTNEPKVSESVLEALGPITRLISERKFNETVNKFVLSLLALYRKTAINAYYISQCISYLLTPSPSNPKLSLNDNVISSINHTLFNLVLLEPDYDQPHTVKNHFEVLRCFDHMAGQFSDQTIESLLNQCKNNNEKDRMRAVIILTHLTTSSHVFVSRFSVKFIGILKVMTNMEQGLKMKKLLVKAIVGLVYRNCLASAEDFLMIEFIIKHCSFDPSNVLKDEIGDLNDTCKSSLILMCNSATHVRTQLRDLLLKSLTEDSLSASISTVTHCLSTLLQNNSTIVSVENKDYVNEFKVSPDLIFVRCLTYLAEPEQIERNKNILLFLNEYSDDVSKNLNNSWAVEMERLLKFVMKNEPSNEWHTMLLALLGSAIDQINSNKWVENISSLLSQQIVNTKQAPVVKGISLQYLAILTCHMSNAALVEQVLKTILLALKAIPMECVELVSNAVGIASRQHGEHVMNELDAYFKEVESRRNNKILNFITSRQSKNEDLNVVRYAIIVCYGKVAAECLDVHVLARLSDNVTVIIYEILKSQPSLDLCRASIATLYEICKALHPASHHNVTLRNRWQLLTIVLEQIYNPNLDKKNIELLPVIVKASTALTKLQKGILPEERNTILRNLFSTVFTELSSFKSKYELEGNGDQNDQLAKNLNDSLTLIHDLIRELIIQSTCLSTIDDLVGILIEWLRHDNDETRTSSILMCQVIFDTYLKNVKLNYETPSKFSQMGQFLGLIVPGIADTNFPVRLTTVDCIKLIIQIQYLYEGHTIESDDQCITELTTLQNNILTNDLSLIADYCATFVDMISDTVPHHHIINFIEVLLGGYDNREMRSTGVSAVLNALFTTKGTELYQNVERIVEVLLNTMDDVDEKAAVKLLRPLTSLARHHTNAVTAVLLAQRLPLDYCVVSCWKNLALDEELSEAIVENFLRLMASIELFENSYQMTDRHIAALQPLTLISALGEMLQQPSMKEICINKFAELFSVLYTTLACYMDAEPPAYALPKNKMAEQHGFIPNRDALRLSPAKITVDTLSAFLEQSECYKIKEACSLCLTIEHGDSVSTLLELVPALSSGVCRTSVQYLAHIMNGYISTLNCSNPQIKEACSLCLTIEHGDSVSTLLELVPALSSGVCRSSAQYLARIVNAVASYARSSLPPHRVAALALLADFLKYRCNENVALIETVLATLKTGWNDECGRVRATALRGAANIAMLREEQRANVLPHALCALSQGIDAPNTPSLTDNVPLASIQGLSRLLVEFDTIDKEYERELLSISQKIRPYMNTESAQLREHSVKLFGIISNKVNSEALVDQAISSLPCFLLHLCDSNPVVVRASKFTLKQIFKTFSAPRANDLVQTHLMDEGRLFIEDFLNALLRLLANELPHTVSRCLQSAVNYLHCAREDLKPYPPLLVGKLYMELFTLRETHPEHSSVDEEVTRSARTRLYHLVKDQDPLVRQHSALALTYLCLVSASD